MPNRIVFESDQIVSAATDYSAGLKSSRELAKEFGVSAGTIVQMLKGAGVRIDRGTGHIHLRRQMLGRPSPRRGATHTAEARRQMSEHRRGRPSTTLGKVYTASQRANISAGLKKGVALRKAAGLILSDQERLARHHVRQIAKRMIRRILLMPRIRPHVRSEALLGYTKQELRERIESQFRPGMSWSDRASFHIDHIVPIAWFLDRGIRDIATINALANLQPLSPRENQTKSARYTQGLG